MTRLRFVIVPLRVLLVLVFAGLVVAQVLSIPGEAFDAPGESPAFQWTFLAVGILEALALQIVIVCTWRLLTLLTADRIFSEKAFVWVDVMAWTIAIAWLLFAVVAAVVVGIIYFTPELRDPGAPVLLVGMTLIGAVVVLVVVVMRSLLRQATALRADLDEVI